MQMPKNFDSDIVKVDKNRAGRRAQHTFYIQREVVPFYFA